MIKRLCIVMLLLLSVTFPSLAGSGARVKIAIWRLKPLGLDATTAEKLEILLRAETSRLKGYVLQSREQTQSILARPQNKKLSKCGGETACLCGIGKILKVNKLVTGVIGGLGDDYTFDLKLVDITSCREERRINEALSGREDLLIGAIRRALYKLIVPRLFVGSMTVEVPVKDAEVLVDDKPVGRTPLPHPISGLRPGSHKLQISKEGFSSFEDTVPVRFQQTTTVKVDLVSSALLGISYEKEGEEKKPEPGPQPLVQPIREKSQITKILAWSSLGLTVAAAIGASLAGWRSNVAENEFQQAVIDQKLDVSYQSVIDRGEKWAMWSNIGWGVAGGAAALTVVLFLVDFVDEEPNNGIQVVPSISEQGAGLVLECPF
ncbi:MAG: PEGA domain-containing protein [Deltaproteobacteria bacterium]|nr:PEGA domain-containing protein [Deltaproteobacteria bacterium]